MNSDKQAEEIMHRVRKVLPYAQFRIVKNVNWERWTKKRKSLVSATNSQR